MAPPRTLAALATTRWIAAIGLRLRRSSSRRPLGEWHYLTANQSRCSGRSHNERSTSAAAADGAHRRRRCLRCRRRRRHQLVSAFLGRVGRRLAENIPLMASAVLVECSSAAESSTARMAWRKPRLVRRNPNWAAWFQLPGRSFSMQAKESPAGGGGAECRTQWLVRQLANWVHSHPVQVSRRLANAAAATNVPDSAVNISVCAPSTIGRRD